MIRLLWLQMRTCLVFFLDSSISLVHHTHFNKRMRILIAKLGLWPSSVQALEPRPRYYKKHLTIFV